MLESVWAKVVSVYGNGKALGIYDGSSTKSWKQGSDAMNPAGYNGNALPQTGSTSQFANSRLIGITPNKTQSGVVADLADGAIDTIRTFIKT